MIDHLDIVADADILNRITEQIPHHADMPGVRYLDEDHQVRNAVFERRVDWVPDAFKGIHFAAAGAFMPVYIFRPTVRETNCGLEQPVD